MGLWDTAFVALPIIFVVLLFGAGFISGSSMTVPDNQKTTPMPSYMAPIFRGLGFPADWLYFPAFIYYAIIPMAGVVLILYGFLDRLMIFREPNVNVLLAIFMGLSTIPMGAFVSTVALLFGFVGVYATIIFGILMVAGIGFVGSGLLGGWRAGALQARLFSEEERKLINVEGQLKRKIQALEDEKKKIAAENLTLADKAAALDERDAEIVRLKKQQKASALSREKLRRLIKEENEKGKQLSRGGTPYYGNVE